MVYDRNINMKHHPVEFINIDQIFFMIRIFEQYKFSCEIHHTV